MSKQPIRPPMDLSAYGPTLDHDSEAQAIIDAAARKVVIAYEGPLAGNILAMLGLDEVAA